MFNYNKLKGRIVELGYGISDIANLLGVSRTSIYERLNGNIPFKDYEIYKICKFLDIREVDIEQYFFNLKVR